MGKIRLLDCTLRDGGYINDWCFGRDAVLGTIRRLELAGVDSIELGFLKGTAYDPDRTLFPDAESTRTLLMNRSAETEYVLMLDMSAPVEKSCIPMHDPGLPDGIRVIFKKERMDEAFDYCAHIRNCGYRLYVNFVCTDQYTEAELAETIRRFNALSPTGMAIVDTFGLMKRRELLRLAEIADREMSPECMLCYHAHNNLQQAFGNAEALVDMALTREVCIDACVFGMGRGAGNLNLELFAEYLNENHGADYRITPILEIMDEYLSEIYRTKFWGYSLPLYLSATLGCHPNYAVYLAEKDTLTVKSFRELLQTMSETDKRNFSCEKAEEYYRRYQENYLDDRAALEKLSERLAGRRVLLLAPGRTLVTHRDAVLAEAAKEDTVTLAVNFLAEDFSPDFVFSSNMRRYGKMQGKTNAVCVTTSNMREAVSDIVVNYASYCSPEAAIADNSGLMALRLLASLGVRRVLIAGMDGYTKKSAHDYLQNDLVYDFSAEAAERNRLIARAIREITSSMDIQFLTPSEYI